MAKNYFSGKFMDGTFATGEGPVSGLKQSSEGENPGLISGGEGGGKTSSLQYVGGKTTITPPTGDDGLFDLHSKTYAGPQNMMPDNQGVTNPFDINKG